MERQLLRLLIQNSHIFLRTLVQGNAASCGESVVLGYI